MSEVKGTRALELWCKRLVRDCPNVQIENMTTSWRNGMAFCALVHHFRPDLIDMSTLKPENIYENNLLAFSVAEKHLGVPALLDPEDMVENDVPDRLSVLTYLSQFYQRLGHTVNTKVSESDSKSTINAPDTSHPVAPIKFGKTGLDKCTACGLPVYLAQRLMVSQKLYHRRCFRCSKCSGHLNPKNYDVVEGSEFTCDSCKNEQNLLKYLNNNDCDQMGMVAYRDDLHNPKLEQLKDDIPSPKNVSRPSSVLEKINMFEKNSDKDTNIDTKVSNLSIRQNSSFKDLINSSGVHSETSAKVEQNMEEIEAPPQIKTPEKIYKSNIDKFNFLQTQLSGDSINIDKTVEDIPPSDLKTKNEFELQEEVIKLKPDNDISAHEEEYNSNSNITDDSRISQIPQNDNESSDKIPLDESTNEVTTELKVPPRRKKLAASEKLNSSKEDKNPKLEVKEYPDHLNPFGTDDEDEKEDTTTIKAPDLSATKVSTNPFGSSDEEDDEVPPIQPLTKPPSVEKNTPMRRVIAVNPFWSDGEEPSSDEEDVQNSSSKSTYSSLTASTPNLMSSTPKRRKPKAPPPPVITITESLNTTSMDDVASISSFSSYNSTVHSDQKSYEKSTPTFKKKRPAPTPPESICNLSGCSSLEKGVDASSLKNASGSEGIGRRTKGPAPGLPLPERREVKLQMSPEELQVQLDLLETQQLGLERQGVLLERMIRDKCEGDEACTAPQEEVEDLVIQLCELVNEKNDLFRKQTELMYIRRQQRLEQEQADIEHEIRIIQSRPAVNRIDADKVREEQLVSRLVEIVLMRDELVQQIEAERRRERQEDLAIAASIASKRAQRNSADSNNSLKADVSNTHKKSKVKDKVKKQLKKAKHTLISKKKEDSPEKKEKKEKEGKEAKNEKENKSK